MVLTSKCNQNSAHRWAICSDKTKIGILRRGSKRYQLAYRLCDDSSWSSRHDRWLMWEPCRFTLSKRAKYWTCEHVRWHSGKQFELGIYN